MRPQAMLTWFGRHGGSSANGRDWPLVDGVGDPSPSGCQGVQDLFPAVCSAGEVFSVWVVGRWRRGRGPSMQLVRWGRWPRCRRLAGTVCSASKCRASDTPPAHPRRPLSLATTSQAHRPLQGLSDNPNLVGCARCQMATWAPCLESRRCERSCSTAQTLVRWPRLYRGATSVVPHLRRRGWSACLTATRPAELSTGAGLPASDLA